MEGEEELPKIPGNFALEGISQISFNKNFTQCALSKNDNEIYIYKVEKVDDISTWTLIETLKDGHSQFVSGIDWSDNSNKILSCSYDKSVIIWEKTMEDWIPNRLVATTKLGYLFASWNTRGDKLITGTSEKKLFVGFYDAKTGWWASKGIKVHKSSVVCAKIDPSSLFIISGSTDLKVYVTSCYEPSVDDQFLTKETKPLAQELGTAVFKFDCSAWVTCVAWSLSGTYAFAGSQNANIVVIDYKKSKKEIIKLNHAPVQYLLPQSDTKFYAVGFDKEIYLYEKTGEKWELKKKVTQDEANIKANTYVIPGEENKEEKKSFIIEGPKNHHLHSADISSVTLKDNTIITTDLIGFVKFWKI